MRTVKAGGPPAAITAGIGVGATGVAGQNIEAKTDPIARGAAQAVGADPQLGPIMLLAVAGLIGVVALFVPGLFDRRHQ